MSDADADAGLLLSTRPFDGCALLTLNRPRVMNALSLPLRRALVRAITALSADAGVQVLVLTGAGAAFCAGLDLQELGAAADPAEAIVPAADTDPVRALAGFAGPVIGAINGVAITGGFELALACDVLIASTQARFADTHARVGVLPGWGLSQRLPRLIGVQRAKSMSLTGSFVDADQAAAWGLVSEVVAPDALLPRALAVALDMLAAAPGMLPAYKRLIDDGLAGGLADGLQLEKERSRAWAAGLDGGAIERRRALVVQRGRSLAAGDGGA